MPDTIKNGVTTTTWYYADASGSCYLNDKFEIDGKTYWFNSGGANLRKSFRSVGKRRRYYDEDGVLQKDCWFSTTSTTTVTGPEAERIPEEERTTENKTWYYADSDGYIVTRTDQEFDGAEYRINKNGTMVTGWQRDSLGDYVYYRDDGAKVYGWMKFELTSDWLHDEFYVNYAKKYGKEVWFYLDPSNEGRAIHPRTQSYGEVTIDGKIYGANKRGMIMFGWVKVKPNFPDKEAYRYFMPEAKDGFLQGQRAQSTWIYDSLPDELGLGTDKTWFYIDEFGDVVRADEKKNEILTKGDRTCLFDNFGRTLSGLAYKSSKNVEIRDIYYFDPEKNNTQAVGLTQVTLPDGRKETYFFRNDGIGATGVIDGYLYYKGRRQIGSGTCAVTYVTNEDNNLADIKQIYLWGVR